MSKLKDYTSLIKFSHTVFALPFALIGFFAAAHSLSFDIEWYKLLLMVLCMIFARNSAMGFNRYADRAIDAQNERTAKREIPAGKITPKNALLFVIANSILFVLATFFINDICFYLSPVALIIVITYSYTKRFTALSHFVLGLGLAIAPIGAYLVLKGSFAPLPIYLSIMVLFWTSGFDIIYSLQDEDFDKKTKLKSIPALLGAKKSLIVSAISHIPVLGIIIFIGLGFDMNSIYWIGATIFIILLVYQHIIVKPKDLSKVNIAFGVTNGIASVLYGVFTILALIL